MTMKRILVVGDSHCVALIEALKNNPPDSYHIDIIVGIGLIVRLITFENGYIFFRDKPASWPRARHPVELFDEWYDTAVDRVRKISPDGKLKADAYQHLIFYGGRLSNTKWYDLPYQAGYSLALKHDVFRAVYQNEAIVAWMDALGGLGTASCQLHCMPDPLMNELGFEHEGEALSNLALIKDMPGGVSYEDTIPFFKEVFLKKYNVAYMPLPDALLNAEKTATRRDFKVETPGDFGHVTVPGAQIILDKMLEEVDRA